MIDVLEAVACGLVFAEVRTLQRRRFELRRQLEYSASNSARGLEFGLQGRF